MFRSIEKNTTAEIVEKKSKFIANLYYIESEEEAERLIKQANKKYFDSRHNCYAFRVMTENGMVSRFSDDGEPSGTAGAPMLNVFATQNLGNILVIVTRYFGGILLGTGGLVKAYTSALMEAINQASIVEKELGKEVEFVIDYPDLEKLKYYLKQNKVNIIHIEYGEKVKLTCEMEQEKMNKILEQKENLNFSKMEYRILREKFVVI